MKKVLLLLSLFVVTLFSCSNDFADIMLRTYSDPFDEAPIIDSYREEYTIFVEWNEDKAADEYILLRAEDSYNGYYFTEIYRGSCLKFTDRNLEPCKSYVYKLDKVRGETLFKSKKVGYGYCSPKQRDIFNNCSKENAQLLEYPLNNMTLCCEKFYGTLPYYEEDWYKVRVPARSRATIDVIQTDPKPSDNSKQIEYCIRGNSYQNVNTNFFLDNESLVEDYLYFKLRVDASEMSVGVLNLTYTIKLVNIAPIDIN